jgi:hypothetical protein
VYVAIRCPLAAYAQFGSANVTPGPTTWAHLAANLEDVTNDALGRLTGMDETITRRSPIGIVLTVAIVGLTLTTAYIHLGLGGLLFTLNGLGYVGLASLVVIGAAVDHPIIRRFAWLPPVALAGYTVATIAGYLVIGPYFALGWIAKGVELALLVVLAVDLLRVHRSPAGLLRTALTSLRFERSAS